MLRGQGKPLSCLVLPQELLPLLLAALQRLLPLLRFLRQLPDLQALLGVLLRQHLQLPLQGVHVQPAKEALGSLLSSASASPAPVPWTGSSQSLRRGFATPLRVAPGFILHPPNTRTGLLGASGHAGEAEELCVTQADMS